MISKYYVNSCFYCCGRKGNMKRHGELISIVTENPFFTFSKTQEENLSKNKTKINFEEMKMIKGIELGSGSYGNVFKYKFEGFNWNLCNQRIFQ